MRARYVWLLLSAVALFCCRAVSADSFVSIGTGVGTACQLGCAGDPNLIGTGINFDLAQVSGDGVLAVILAVPNDSNFIGSITVQGGTGGFLGFNSSTDIYTFLAQNHLGQDFDHYVVPNGVLSDNLLNLETADSRIDGITSSGYGIYLFEVGGGNPASGFLSVNAMNIPLGSFVFGLGEKGGD